MISFVKSRKPVDDHEPSNRQSLPLVPEVIQGTKPGPYPPIPPSSIQLGLSLPSPFGPASRSFPEAEKHFPLQPLHTVSSFPRRQDAHPAFSDTPKPPFANRSLSPPVSNRRQRLSVEPEILTQHRPPEQQKPPELHRPLNGVYAHPPPPLPPPPPVAYQPGQLSPRQMPLPACMISPRHAAPPHVPGLYDPRAPPHAEEADYATRALYNATVKIYFESWSYKDSLSRIVSSSRTIFNFVEAYRRIAEEQHGALLIPESLPTGEEVSDMLSNIDIIKRSLEQVRDLVQISIQNERTFEETKWKGPNEDEHDVLMHRDAMKP